MIEKYPLMNEYWEDKRGKSHLINVPAYILASMSSGLHTVGSTRSYEDIPHDKKWYSRGLRFFALLHGVLIRSSRLRINGTQEWYDLYQDGSVQDFRKFLDFYTKDIKNGWEETPRARVSVLRFNKVIIVSSHLLILVHTDRKHFSTSRSLIGPLQRLSFAACSCPTMAN
jgi:hypothetical protein